MIWHINYGDFCDDCIVTSETGWELKDYCKHYILFDLPTPDSCAIFLF